MVKQMFEAPAALAAFVATTSATLAWIGTAVWAAVWFAHMLLQ